MVPCKHFLNFDTEIKKGVYKQKQRKNQHKTKKLKYKKNNVLILAPNLKLNESKWDTKECWFLNFGIKIKQKK